VSYVWDRPKRRLRTQTLFVILLTALFAVGGTAMTVLAVAMSAGAPGVVRMLR